MSVSQPVSVYPHCHFTFIPLPAVDDSLNASFFFFAVHFIVYLPRSVRFSPSSRSSPFFAKLASHSPRFAQQFSFGGEIFICAIYITVGLCQCDSFRSVNLVKCTQLQPLLASRILLYLSISLPQT